MMYSFYPDFLNQRKYVVADHAYFMPSKFNGPFRPVSGVQVVEKSSSNSSRQKIARKKNEGKLERKKGGNYRPLAF